MANKASNVFGMLANAKTRTFVILFGALLVGGVAIAVMRSKSAPSDVLSQQPSQAASPPSNIQSIPGSAAPEKYREITMAQNTKRAEEALQQRKSAIPTIIGSSPQIADSFPDINQTINLDSAKPDSQLNLFGDARTPQERLQAEQQARIKENQDRIDRIQADRQRNLDNEKQQTARAEELNKTMGQMKSYADGAYGEWSKVSTQQYVQGELANPTNATNTQSYVRNVRSFDSAPSFNSSNTPFAANTAVKPTPAKSNKALIKAGTIVFGVLDTAINSDEIGPVLATIVSGKLNGARLIGSLTHQNQQESVSVNFNTMSLPKADKSVSVRVVAIDPDTARTALASNVDHHYLLRYGSLFASSFVQGYGQAISEQGTTQVTTNGTVVTTKPPIDNRKIFFAALGQLGQAWSQQAQQNFSTPYTVTVNQGTSVGLLFLTDLQSLEE